MKAFAALYEELDTTQSTNLKVAAMARYFREAPPADAAWATYMLSGRRLKRFIGPAVLKRWLIEAVALPEWLVDESYSSVGDLAETTSTARYTTSEPGSEKPVELSVSNQTVWRKPTGKPWMIVSDYNVELPSAAKPELAAATD